MTVGPRKSLEQLRQIERALGIDHDGKATTPWSVDSYNPPPPSTVTGRTQDDYGTGAAGRNPWVPAPIDPSRSVKPPPSPPPDTPPEPASPPVAIITAKRVNWLVVLAAAVATLLLPIFGKSAWLRTQPALDAVLVGVPDGDSLDVRIGGAPAARIDIAEIAAPDRGTPAGKRARTELGAIVQGKDIRLWPVGMTPEGRPIMIVHAGQTDVARAMVSRGEAMACRYLILDPLVPISAGQARMHGRGIWSDEYAPSPADFTADASCTALRSRWWLP